MNVLHITNNYPTSKHPIFGIFVKEQIDSLTSLGINNNVFFINTREKGRNEYIHSIIRLWKHLRSNKYDILHCHHSFSALVLLFSGQWIKNKTVLSYQNPPEKEGGTFLFKLLYHIFDRIILKNKSPEINFAKTLYLPNGVNTELFLPINKSLSKKKLGLDENKRYIVFMDSHSRRSQKRIDRFDETINLLKSKYSLPDIEPLKLFNVKRELIPYYLCSAELHLLTSDFEGSPNSVKECLACNVSVVSTPVGNVFEMIGDVDGFYVSSSFDPQELAQLSYKALQFNTINSRDVLVQKGLEIKSIATKLVTLYNNLVNL